MKITIPGLLEGDLAKKQDILDTRTVWNDVDTNVDEKNIREEGLDRRVFQQGRTWVSQGQQATASQRYEITFPADWYFMSLAGNLHGSDPPEFIGEPVSGGVDSVYPALSFNWDPAEHSYAIIRLSLWVWADITHLATYDFAPEFGIWVKTPEQANDGIDPVLDEATDLVPGNSIKTWKSVRLCGDYLSDNATPPDTGLVNEYYHSRLSKLSASVSMLYAVNSGEAQGSGHGSRTTGWDVAGTPTFRVVHKGGSGVPGSTGGSKRVVVGNMNFSVQVFRR